MHHQEEVRNALLREYLQLRREGHTHNIALLKMSRKRGESSKSFRNTIERSLIPLMQARLFRKVMPEEDVQKVLVYLRSREQGRTHREAVHDTAEKLQLDPRSLKCELDEIFKNTLADPEVANSRSISLPK